MIQFFPRTLSCTLLLAALAACGGGSADPAATLPVPSGQSIVGAPASPPAAPPTAPAPVPAAGSHMPCSTCGFSPDGLADEFLARGEMAPVPDSVQSGYPQVPPDAVMIIEPFAAVSVGSGAETRVF